MCSYDQRNTLRKCVWCFLSHAEIQFYETLKNVLCGLQNALPFYILRQYKTNSPLSLTKIISLCGKNKGKKDRKDQAPLFLAHLQLSGQEVPKKYTDVFPIK